MRSFTWCVKENVAQRDFTVRAENELVARVKLLEFLDLHTTLYQKYNLLRLTQQLWYQSPCVCAKYPKLCLKCFVRTDVQKEQEQIEQLQKSLMIMLMHNFVQFNTTNPWWVQHGNPPVTHPYTGAVTTLKSYISKTAPVVNI